MAKAHIASLTQSAANATRSVIMINNKTAFVPANDTRI